MNTAMAITLRDLAEIGAAVARGCRKAAGKERWER